MAAPPMCARRFPVLFNAFAGFFCKKFLPADFNARKVTTFEFSGRLSLSISSFARNPGIIGGLNQFLRRFALPSVGNVIWTKRNKTGCIYDDIQTGTKD